MSFYWMTRHQVQFAIFDYQGYGASEGEPSPKNSVEDGIVALRWASAEAQKLKVPLIVYGQSLGGAVALRSVAEVMSDIPVSLVVADSSFYSYQAAGRSVLGNHWITWLFQWLPWLALSDEWAPEDNIADLSPIPLLVIHGNKDPVIDISLGREIYRLAELPKEFWEVENGRHIDVFMTSRKFCYHLQCSTQIGNQLHIRL